MKFGCLYYADSENIGDDIQTYAQWRFLPKVDYWIDRESLHLFCPDENYKVALIMNAWFMYSPQNWPPSPYISPLFVSTHFSKYHVQWLKSGKEEYAFAQNYLRENAPIGCRDASTLQTLQELNIEAYFSGCLTMTLQPFPEIEKQEYICLVDVSQEVVDYVKSQGYNVRVMSHNLINAAKMTPEERLKQAEEYLKTYQAARCVLTSRLHCALPCTGLGTPVLVLYSSDYDERFNALKGFLHTTNEEQLLQGKWDAFLKTPFSHSANYLQYANGLAERCRKFVDTALKQEEQVNVSYEHYKEMFALQNVIQKETYVAEIRRLSDGYGQLSAQFGKLWDEKETYVAEIRRLSDGYGQLSAQFGKLWDEKETLRRQYVELEDYAGRLRRLRADALRLLHEAERKDR